MTMEADRLEFFRKLLQDQLRELLTEAGLTVGELTRDHENVADPIDLASMESNRDFQLRIRDRERTLIYKVKDALNRIDNGEYGICAMCGEDISERRLIARTVATHCIDCKTEFEQLANRTRDF
jgi:DnaK suppressor protein